MKVKSSNLGPFLKAKDACASPYSEAVELKAKLVNSNGYIPSWVNRWSTGKAAQGPYSGPEFRAATSAASIAYLGHSKSLLTVAETASFFRVSEKTIRRMISRGELPFTRIGRSIRIDPEVIEKIVHHNE